MTTPTSPSQPKTASLQITKTASLQITKTVFLRIIRTVSIRSTILVCLMMVLSTGAAAQSVMFGAGATYPGGDGPWGIVSADFNGDGRPDIAVSNHGTSATPVPNASGATVLLARADGTFAPGVAYPGGLGPTYMVAADFDKDGRVDLATANSANNISVMRGNGDGTFAAAANYATPSAAGDITTADYNKDGFLDLAMPVSGGIGVMLANNTGGFNPIVVYPAVSGSTVRQGDFNGDKKLDIVTTSITTKSVTVLPGNGDGTASQLL